MDVGFAESVLPEAQAPGLKKQALICRTQDPWPALRGVRSQLLILRIRATCLSRECAAHLHLVQFEFARVAVQAMCHIGVRLLGQPIEHIFHPDHFIFTHGRVARHGKYADLGTTMSG